MDLAFTPEEQAFREDIRAWVRSHLPADISQKVFNAQRLGRDDMQRWAKILGKKGWLGWGWPKEFGGPGWNAVQKHLFEEECALAGSPRVVPFGPVMVAPGDHGVWQRRAATALSARHRQRRGLVEPGLQRTGLGLGPGLGQIPAPSAWATSTSSTARRPGPRWASTANGFSAWCAPATKASHRLASAFLLIDMKSPGVSVRPIVLMDGEPEVNEVWFDNVEVPAHNLIGEENKGWTYAKHLLSHERTNIADVNRSQARAGAPQAHRQSRRRVRRPALPGRSGQAGGGRGGAGNAGAAGAERREIRQAEPGHRRPAEDPRQRNPAALHRADDAGGRPVELAFHLRGDGGRLARRPCRACALRTSPNYFNMRKTTIYGGSNEVQRNIVSQVVLG